MKTLLIAFIIFCITVASHAQTYQPPALYSDTASLQKHLAAEPRLVRARFQDGLTLLHFAALTGDTTGARLILDKGANVDAADKFGRTPLHMVHMLGITEVLLDRGADVTIRDKNGRMPFDVAVIEGHKAVADVLGKQMILSAAASKDLQTVQRILNASPYAAKAQAKNGATPLHFAAEGQVAMCKLLLVKGADVAARKNDGVTPLHVAGGLGKTEIVKLFLANGADPNVKDGKNRTPYSLATERGYKATAQILLSAMNKEQPAPDQSEQSAKGLFLFIRQDNMAGVTKSLNSDASLVKATDESGMTALMVALHSGKSDIAKLLIAKGADVNAKDVNGATPIFHALSDPDLTQLLISKGARVNSRSKNNRTALHEVASFGTEEVAEFLISKGAEVNARDIDGKTPLTCAMQSGNRTSMIKTLRSHGAKQ